MNITKATRWRVFAGVWLQREYPKVCVNLQTDVR